MLRFISYKIEWTKKQQYDCGIYAFSIIVVKNRAESSMFRTVEVIFFSRN